MRRKSAAITAFLAAMSLMSVPDCGRPRISKNQDSENGPVSPRSPEPVPPPRSDPSIDLNRSGADWIRITSPIRRAKVVYREIVRGTVSNPKAEVWVIVHPMAVPGYWVQPKVEVDDDGSWWVRVYIAQSPYSSNGEHFKILAVANPRTQLAEGDILKAWPEAQRQSRVVEVIKKDPVKNVF